MTAYCFARVTGPQDHDGWWPAEAVSPLPDGTTRQSGFVAVFSGNGLVPLPGLIYPGIPSGWFVVVNPTPLAELPPRPEPPIPDTTSHVGLTEAT